MRELGLVGLSEDVEHVVLRDDAGEQFRVRIDDRLRAAIRGDRVRLGQVENNMDSALRPRDIQARIRSGESPEAVAAVAQVSLERIMGYALPVLAEREHVCRQARQSGLRRKHASGPGRLFGIAVDEHLRGNGWDPEAASWDSWRRDDGRWSVTVAASTNASPATFLFDAPGRYVVAHDDAARQLVGDEPPLSVEPETDEPRSGLPPLASVGAGRARVTRLPREEPPGDLGDLDPVGDTADLGALTADLAALEAEAAAAAADADAAPGDGGAADAAHPPARVRGLDRLRRQRARVDEPLPFDDDADVEAVARALAAPAQDLPMAVGESVGESGSESGSESGGDDGAGGAHPAGAEHRRRKSGRRAVPSWDEIMFGSKPQG